MHVQSSGHTHTHARTHAYRRAHTASKSTDLLQFLKQRHFPPEGDTFALFHYRHKSATIFHFQVTSYIRTNYFRSSPYGNIRASPELSAYKDHYNRLWEIVPALNDQPSPLQGHARDLQWYLLGQTPRVNRSFYIELSVYNDHGYRYYETLPVLIDLL